MKKSLRREEVFRYGVKRKEKKKKLNKSFSDKFHGKKLRNLLVLLRIPSLSLCSSLCFWQFLFAPGLSCDISDYFDFSTSQLTLTTAPSVWSGNGSEAMENNKLWADNARFRVTKIKTSLNASFEAWKYSTFFGRNIFNLPKPNELFVIKIKQNMLRRRMGFNSNALGAKNVNKLHVD